MCLDKELLFKVYDRIYNERSENDKKRDQIIAFYTTLIGIMFAIFQKFSFSEIVEKFDIKLKIFLLFYIFIINLIVAQVILRLRRYHIMYCLAIEALQRLLANYNTNGIQENINIYFKNSYYRKYPKKEKNINGLNNNDYDSEQSTNNILKNIISKIKSIEVLFYIFYIEISVPLLLILIYSIKPDTTFLFVFGIIYNVILLFLLRCNEYRLEEIDSFGPIESFLDFSKLI